MKILSIALDIVSAVLSCVVIYLIIRQQIRERRVEK